MSERALFRLEDMRQAIANIRRLLQGKTLEAIRDETMTRAAFERFLEIISEASRHIPDDWKSAVAPAIPWRQVADLGNVLRHAYDKTDAAALWSIYEDDLDALSNAVDRLIAVYGSASTPSPPRSP